MSIFGRDNTIIVCAWKLRFRDIRLVFELHIDKGTSDIFAPQPVWMTVNTCLSLIESAHGEKV